MSVTHRGPRRCLAPAGWTPEMDALLAEGLAQRLTYRAIGETMRTAGFGDRSADAVRERAKRLELVATDGLTEGALDCRRGGADPLLAALARAHEVPPADVPVIKTSVPMNGRLLVPVGGGAGSPGALCAEGGEKAILARKGRPPQGGALPDYEAMALEVPGVLKAWAFAFTGGVGSIVVFFLFRGRPNLIPTDADVAVVQAYIDARRLIRVDCDVAAAPTPDPVDITITDLAVDTDEVRAAIATNLAALFFERAKPGVVADPFTLYRSWISEAISTATGEDSHTLTVPASDLVFTASYPVLGTITYA